MNSVQPKYHRLIELLEGRLFRIPSYQRSYSWEARQRQDLFDDITKTFKKDTYHFMATIVCLKRHDEIRKVGSKELFVYDIVDGQQRLTTLVALLKAISIELKKGNTEEIEESNEIEKLLVKGENKDIILLQTNHNEAELFREYIRDCVIPDKNSIKTLAEKNLYDLFVSCKKFVSDWKNKEGRKIIELLSIVKNRLGFIFYEIDDESIVYTVFEVLNSRGLVVNWLDKTKSVLMGIVYEKFGKLTNSREYIQQLQSYWGEIYKILGVKEINGDELLTFTAAFLYSEKEKGKLPSNETALDFFKNFSYKNADNILKIASTILAVATKVKELSDIPEYNFFYSIQQARYLYVSIVINRLLDINEKREILEHWEKILFRTYGMMKDTRRNVGDFIRLGKEIFNNNIYNPLNKKDNLYEYEKFESLNFKEKIIFRIEEIGKDSPIKVALESLRDKRNWHRDAQQELKYFFFKYEKYIATVRKAAIRYDLWENIFMSSANDSIEHICPESDPYKNWVGTMGNEKNAFDNNVNRLGNLVVLTSQINSRCGTKAFNGKKVAYKDAFLHVVNDILYVDYLKNGDARERMLWDKNSIDKREDHLLQIAFEIWS